MVPLILLCGQAGSGKDTIGNIIAERHNGVCIALADPMKRLAFDVFCFTEEQLWGSSEFRNAPDHRHNYDEWEPWDFFEEDMGAFAPGWLEDLYPGAKVAPLLSWMRDLRQYYLTTKNLLTPRHVLQQLGTEFGRKNLHKDVWVDYAIKVAQKLLGGGYRYRRTAGLIEDPKYAGPDWVVITDGRFKNEIIKVQSTGGMVARIVDPNKEETATGHVSETELTQIPRHFYNAVIENNKKLDFELLYGAVEWLLRPAGEVRTRWAF